MTTEAGGPVRTVRARGAVTFHSVEIDRARLLHALKTALPYRLGHPWGAEEVDAVIEAYIGHEPQTLNTRTSD